MTEQAPPPPAWFFLLLAFVGGAYSASLSFRLFSYLALSLRPPRDLRRRYGAWAVVTGPTSGIGRSVALELARRGLNLVLLDLDAANLEETSDMVVSRHGVETKTVAFDLSLVGTPQGNDTSQYVARVPERLGPKGICISFILLVVVRRRVREAAPSGDRGAGRRGAGEQRRGVKAVHGVPARGRRGGVGADGACEPVGPDGGDGRCPARDAGAPAGSHRQHGLRVVGGHPLLPTQHHLRRH